MVFGQQQGLVCLTHGFFATSTAEIDAHLGIEPCDVVGAFRTVPQGQQVKTGLNLAATVFVDQFATPSQSFQVGETVVGEEDAGSTGWLMVRRLMVPPRLATLAFATIRVTFHDGSHIDIDNPTSVALTLNQDQFDDAVLVPANDGRSVRKLSFLLKNNSLAPLVGALGVFRARGYCAPAGIGVMA